MRIPSLYLTSIICGFCMMALEILGGRLLQPVFGSSVDVWAAIISVFILSLSVGYVLGGRIADRARTNLPLAWVVLVSGVFYCLLPVYGLGFTNVLPAGLVTASWGVLVGALGLFLAPSLLLGCVSPMLVKLVFDDPQRIGRITGTLYAIGSVGNVLGVLVGNYLLLRFLTLNASLLILGGALLAVGLCHLFVRCESALAHSDGGARP
jgi:hypothetical protein